MSAATATEWLACAGVGTAAFVPGALLILALDHDLHLPHVDVQAVSAAVERARQATARQVAAWLVALAWHITPTEATR